MARDYTKYNVQGLGENLNKRQLVYTIIKDYIEKNNPSLETLLSVFPDELQGSKGVIRKESDVDDPKRFNMKEPLKIKNGMHVVVSNQWGDNIPGFIDVAEKLGYEIKFKNNYTTSEISSNLNDKNLSVIVEFGVVSDENGKIELRFENNFEFNNLLRKVNPELYENIIRNEDVLHFCKNEIHNLDKYLLENGNYYNLIILKIDNLNLDFLWEIDFDNVLKDNFQLENLKKFFADDYNDDFLEELEENISDFKTDNLCSLEYINTL